MGYHRGHGANKLGTPEERSMREDITILKGTIIQLRQEKEELVDALENLLLNHPTEDGYLHSVEAAKKVLVKVRRKTVEE